MTSQGSSPLHLACEWGRIAAAEALLRLGALADVVDRSGRTPFDCLKNESDKSDLMMFKASLKGHTSRVVKPVKFSLFSPSAPLLPICETERTDSTSTSLDNSAHSCSSSMITARSTCSDTEPEQRCDGGSEWRNLYEKKEKELQTMEKELQMHREFVERQRMTIEKV
jgi:hypothetical protein